MRFKLDENLPGELMLDLARAGHDADTVAQEGVAGAADSEVLEAIRRDDRILWTLDKGIANIQRFPPAAFPGIVLFRPGSMGRGKVIEFVRSHVNKLLQLELKGRLVVVSVGGIRFR